MKKERILSYQLARKFTEDDLEYVSAGEGTQRFDVTVTFSAGSVDTMGQYLPD